MRKIGMCLVVLGAGVLAFAMTRTTATAAATEEVFAKMSKREGEMKTFETDTKTTMKAREEGMGKMEGTGHIVAQAVIKDDKPVGNLMNMKQTMKTPTGDMKMLMVNDGKFLWVESTDPMTGMVTVMKHKPDMAAGQDPAVDMKGFREMYELKLAGEEEFDGQKCWMLEGTPTEKAKKSSGGAGPRGMMAAPEPGKVRIYIGQKDLMSHRQITYDKAGNEMMDMQYRNMKVNGKVDPALFKYTPPPDALVMDMTKGPDLEALKKLIPKDLP